MSRRTLAYAEVMRVGKICICESLRGKQHSPALPSNTSHLYPEDSHSRRHRKKDLFVCHLLVSLPLPEACNQPSLPEQRKKKSWSQGKEACMWCVCVTRCHLANPVQPAPAGDELPCRSEQGKGWCMLGMFCRSHALVTLQRDSMNRWIITLGT